MVARKRECLLYQKTEEVPEMEDCAQAEVISEIKETLKTVAQAVNRIAVQDERLLAHDRKNMEQEGDINILYDRVRKVETILGLEGDGIRMKVVDAFKPFTDQLERLGRFLDVVTSRAFVWVCVSLMIMTIIGTLCDLSYHADLLMKLVVLAKKTWGFIPR